MLGFIGFRCGYIYEWWVKSIQNCIWSRYSCNSLFKYQKGIISRNSSIKSIDIVYFYNIFIWGECYWKIGDYFIIDFINGIYQKGGRGVF